MTILGTSKLKQFAGDKFRFDKNGRQFSRNVENNVEKGEIAYYKTGGNVTQRFVLEKVIPWITQHSEPQKVSIQQRPPPPPTHTHTHTHTHIVKPC